MLLVGPEAKVNTGWSAAKSAFIKVPSFWLIKKGALISMAASAALKPETVFMASSRRQAFMMAAFSRSSNPIRPMVLESVMFASGITCFTTSAAFSSNAAFTGENTDEIAMALTPFCLMSSAMRRISSGSNGEISRPSNSCPPWAR